jgi:prepilin-type N-terminal cleavage/methylation domain-containing protein
MMGFKLSLSSAGFTLVEVLVATGLFGIVTAGAAVAAMAFLKNAQETSLRMTRDQVVTQLRMTATNKKAILLSMKKPENIAFYNCICGKGTCTNMQQPFASFSLFDNSGQLQGPAYYDSSGMPCDFHSPQCALRVITKFYAQCKPDLTSGNQNPSASCNGIPADFVTVYYTVDENPNSAGQQRVPLRPVSGPIYIQASDLEVGACL